MNRPAREVIIAAFCARIFAATGFRTTSRRLKPWGEVTEQPACFVRHIGDNYEYQDILQRVTMRLEVWIYAQSSLDSAVSPGEYLSPLVDAIDAALAPDDDNLGTTTLGGLVAHAWVQGETQFDPGDFDNQAKAVIPVHILLP